jgi:hypothetical protein
MVKNLPTVERSTKIRFGKHVPDSMDQEENTIVFNASNVLVPTPYSNSVYLSPIRNRSNYQAPEIVLLMYDRNTKEITESGESANALIGGVTLNTAVARSNITSNTVQFVGGGMLNNNVGFVTDSNIGISNLNPQHTLSVGSNLYVDEFGSNVLVVSGNVAILDNLVVDGNLRVNGGTTVVDTKNLSIGDAIIEIGRNNTSSDTTLDLGILMHRPDALSNVVIGYREGTDEFTIAYTESKPTDKTFTPKTDEDINVHVYGLTHVDANIYAHQDLLVTGNVYVSTNVDITKELTVTGNVYADKDLEVIGNIITHTDLSVTGNVTVDSTTLHVDAGTNRLGLGTITPKATLDIVGNVHVTSNISTASNVLITGDAVTSSKTTGALQVTGGVGIQGDLYATHANLEDVEADSITVTDATHSTSKDTGALIVTQGGLGVEANIHSTNVFAASHIAVGTSATSNTFDVRGTANVGALVSTSTHISDSTAASSKTSGALQVKGGTGIQGALHAADTTLDSVKAVNLSTGTIPFTDAAKKLINSIITQDTEGNISISGNVEITGNISVLGNSFAITSNDLIINDRIIDIANTNSSTTLDIGILMEHPGKNIFIGHHTSPHDHFSIGYTDAGYSADQVEWTGTDHITANVWGHLITQNTVTVQYGNVYIVDGGLGIGIGDGENDDVPDSKLYVTGNAHITSNISTASNVLITGIAAATSKTTGALQVTGGVGISGDIYATDANLENVEADSVTVTDTTHSTSKDTGAIIVTTGGVGVESNIHTTNLFATSHIGVGTTATSNVLDIRGTANVGALVTTSTHISDTTTSTTTTTGALKVAGGISTQEKLNVGGVTKVWDNTNAASKTVAALIVVGGVGVTGDIHATDANLENVEADSVTVTDTTHSTSKDTGAIIVTTGGIGVEANIHSTNVFATSHIGVGTTATSNTFDVRGTANVGALVTTSTHISDTTTSTTTTTGALKVAGGISTQEKLNVGGVTKVWDNTNAGATNQGALQVVGGLGVGQTIFAADMSSGSVTVTDTTHSTSKDTGAIIVTTGGLGVEANVHSTNVFATSHIGIGTSATSNTFDVRGTANVGALVTTSTHISDTTTSTTTTTGALKVAGGISTQEKLNVGGVTKVWDNTNAGATNEGAVQIVGGLGVGQTIFAADMSSGSVTVTDDSTSTTKDTGALIITDGGVGIEENLNVGGFTKVWDNSTSTTTTSGALKVVGGVGVVENLNVGGVTKVWDNTNAGATNQGALQVVGGLGVGQTIFAADMSSGSVTVTDTTQATLTTTGALKVAGGISTQTNVHASNVYTYGGLITNRSGTCKKTYSHTGALPTNASIANATFTVVFSNHVFQAKIYAVLVEATATVSSITQECCGGHLTGGTPGTITVGTTNVIGQNGYPWDTVVASNGTTVTIKAKQVLVGAGNYNIFVEYLSAHADGKVLKFTEGGSDEITFNY